MNTELTLLIDQEQLISLQEKKKHVDTQEDVLENKYIAELQECILKREVVIDDIHVQLKAQIKKRQQDPELILLAQEIRKPVNRIRKVLRSLIKIYASQQQAITRTEVQKYSTLVYEEQELYRLLEARSRPFLDTIRNEFTIKREYINPVALLYSTLTHVCLVTTNHQEEIDTDIARYTFSQVQKIATFNEETQSLLS